LAAVCLVGAEEAEAVAGWWPGDVAEAVGVVRLGPVGTPTLGVGEISVVGVGDGAVEDGAVPIDAPAVGTEVWVGSGVVAVRFEVGAALGAEDVLRPPAGSVEAACAAGPAAVNSSSAAAAAERAAGCPRR